MATIPEMTLEEEVNKFRNGAPYDATVICEEINSKIVAFMSTQGTRYEDKNSMELLNLVVDGFPAICRYVTDNERSKSSMVAAYMDATKRKTDATNDKLFWQLGACSLATLVVIWLAFRCYAWLGPHVEEMVHYYAGA